jgi:FKBP-type peptidyl-prolyl cis-trans isomerase 2
LRRGYKTWIKYKAYFFKDHLIFDQTKDKPIELSLGDNSFPDGLLTGVEKMRKGEIAKIRIKKLHGFGRPLRVEQLRFPQHYE